MAPAMERFNKMFLSVSGVFCIILYHYFLSLEYVKVCYGFVVFVCLLVCFSVLESTIKFHGLQIKILKLVQIF